jgi:hypothetical protein
MHSKLSSLHGTLLDVGTTSLRTLVEMWLNKHGGQLPDILVFKSRIRELLQCETDGEMIMNLATLQQTWSESYNLQNRILQAYAGWLKAIGLKVNSVLFQTCQNHLM